MTDGGLQGPWNDGDCVLPQFLEDSRGLERLDRREDSVPMSLHDECPVDECFSSDLSSPPPSEGSLCENECVPGNQDSAQLDYNAPETRTTTADTSVEKGKLKRKSSRIEVFDPTALEDDWITSVRTRGQLRMILNPVPDAMVKPEPAEQQTYQSPPRKRVTSTANPMSNAVSNAVDPRYDPNSIIIKNGIPLVPSACHGYLPPPLSPYPIFLVVLC